MSSSRQFAYCLSLGKDIAVFFPPFYTQLIYLFSRKQVGLSVQVKSNWGEKKKVGYFSTWNQFELLADRWLRSADTLQDGEMLKNRMETFTVDYVSLLCVRFLRLQISKELMALFLIRHLLLQPNVFVFRGYPCLK